MTGDDLTRLIGRLNQTDNAAKKTGTSASKAGRDFLDFAKKILAVNAAIEFAKKAFNLLERALTTVISRSLEFRYSWDPAKKELLETGNAIHILEARIGDALIPLLIGLSRGFTPVIEAMKRWGEENNKIMQSKLVDFVIDLATVLVSGAATAADIAQQAYKRLTIVWLEANAAAKDMAATTLISRDAMEGLTADQMADQKVLSDQLREEAKERHAEAVRALTEMDQNSAAIESFAQKLFDALEASRQFGKTYVDNAKKANKATKELEEEMRRLAEFQNQLAQEAVDDFNEHQAALAEARAKAAEEEEAFREKVQQEAIEDFNEHQASIAEARAQAEEAARARGREYFQAAKERQDRENEDMLRARQGLAQSMASTISQPFEAIFSGTATAEEAFSQMLDNMLARITAFVTESVVLTFLSLLLGLPTAGIGGGVVGAIGGLLGFNRGGLVPSFAGGGYVPMYPGARAGADSVHALLTPGEFVLPVEVVDAIRRSSAPSRPQRYASGGSVQRGPTQGPSAVVFQMAGFPSSQSEIDRWMEQSFVPSWRRLKSRGVLP